MSFSTPLWPGIVLALLAIFLLRKPRRIWAFSLVLTTTALLYWEHVNRVILVGRVCNDEARYLASGTPQPFDGVYMQLGHKHTWEDLQSVIDSVPSSSTGMSSLPISYVDVDIAQSHIYLPKRHRFEFGEPRVFQGRKVCGARPNSWWATDDAYLKLRDRLITKDICFSINMVEGSPGVEAEKCISGEGWRECTYFDVVPEGRPIPLYSKEEQKSERGNWLSSVSIRKVSYKIKSFDDAWLAQSSTVFFDESVDSWLVRLSAAAFGQRSVFRFCGAPPLFPTLAKSFQ